MENGNQLVVLLHGIGRTHLSMRSIEKMLLKENYLTLNIHYPSRKKTIQELAAFVFNKIQQFPNVNSLDIHFVTHSMGSLVTRVLLDQFPLANAKRIVMLGPPNQGSEVADFLKKNWVFKYFYGPSGQQLTTIHAKISPFPVLKQEVGIIAGNFCIEPISYFLLPSKNDGLVTIESTKLFGMTDHIVLPVTHAFMILNKRVKFQILHFLQHGSFAH